MPRGSWILAIAAVAALGAQGASAQSTSGSIFGQAPVGGTVTVKSNAGGSRHAEVKDSGRYRIDGLRLGMYTVTLQKDGKDVDTRSNVPLKVGGAVEIDFACPNDQCAKPEGSG
ncbi:hypothetical protein BV497_09450 [Fulvimonas soli]|jgi:hypothetical protein|nr:hypothetical protein BV497_09450 [Fulvimonas soli]